MKAKARGRRPGSKNYSREFREAVVAQANDPGRSIAEVAQEHGLKPHAGSPFSGVNATLESLFKCQRERPFHLGRYC